MIDMSDPESPLFCPRATLLGAIHHLILRRQALDSEAGLLALRVLVHAFDTCTVEFIRRLWNEKTRPDKRVRLARPNLLRDADDETDLPARER